MTFPTMMCGILRSRAGRRFRRLAAALAAMLLLATRGADAFGVHPCPHHDALPASPAAHMAGGHAHGAVAGPMGAPAGDAGAPAHGAHAACTCVGDCCTSGAVALSAAAAAAALGRPPAALSASAPPATPVLGSAHLDLLPDTHAPPRHG